MEVVSEIEDDLVDKVILTLLSEQVSVPDSALLSARNSEEPPVQPSVVSEVASSELASAREVSVVAVVTWSLHVLKQCKKEWRRKKMQTYEYNNNNNNNNSVMNYKSQQKFRLIKRGFLIPFT